MDKAVRPAEGPVFIIAAARSGTKMLRAALAQSSDFVDFHYDMNYIWKFGNYDIPHDELTVDDLDENIRAFIKGRFDKLLARSGKARVLEKTVSNSLRVEFVREVFPNGRIVHLFRDGRDVAADARLCWQASAFSERIQPAGDRIRKVLDFPFAAAFPYIKEYLSNYVSRLFSGSKHVKSWGPVFRGMDEFAKSHSLLQTCGMQWERSVEASLRGLSLLRDGVDYIDLRYEDLVSEPVRELGRVADFLNIRDTRPVMQYAATKISPDYVGFWKDNASAEEMKETMPYMEAGLRSLGYD